jgi:hypothetical protein
VNGTFIARLAGDEFFAGNIFDAGLVDGGVDAAQRA